MTASRPPSNSNPGDSRSQLWPVDSASTGGRERKASAAGEGCAGPPSIAAADVSAAPPIAVGGPVPARAPVPAGELAERRQLAAWATGLIDYLTRHMTRARSTPAFMVSLIFHTSLLILLALLSWTGQGGSIRSFDFTASTAAIEGADATPPLLMADGDAPPPPALVQDESPEPPAPSPTSTASTLAELLSQQAPPNQQTSENAWEQLVQATANSATASFVGSGVSGRQLDRRQEIALARGGTLESEAAVERALEWLAAHQLPNGGWSLVHDTGECNGRCSDNGSTDRFDPSATGLSLLAFLGAGYTHREGKHRETVRRGIYFLLQIVDETPQGASFLYQSERGMYNHGIAAFALCEAFQMTNDPELRARAQGAVDFIVAGQNYQGGWGYLPKQPGDLTLTGWQIMALKSAYAAGLEVPPSTIIRVDPFLDSQQTPSSFFYGYQRPGKSPTCTSIGLLLRLFRGLPSTHPTLLDGSAYLAKTTRPNTDAYFNYYATLLLFHVGGPGWEPWNERMREHLIDSQEQSGHMAGSWYFEDPYGREGGRLYTTAMCAMTLEIYYRFAPIYQQADVKFEL